MAPNCTGWFKYYSHDLMSNVLPLFNLFSQYGIYTKPFLHFINCLCNIISFTVKLRSVHACWLVLGILVFCLIFFFFFFENIDLKSNFYSSNPKILQTFHNWDKVFKNRPSNIHGRQLLKNLKGYGLLKHGLLYLHGRLYCIFVPKIVSWKLKGIAMVPKLQSD